MSQYSRVSTYNQCRGECCTPQEPNVALQSAHPRSLIGLRQATHSFTFTQFPKVSWHIQQYLRAAKHITARKQESVHGVDSNRHLHPSLDMACPDKQSSSRTEVVLGNYIDTACLRARVLLVISFLLPRPLSDVQAILLYQRMRTLLTN